MIEMKLPQPATIDDLMRCPEDGRKYELVDGRIVVSPTGFQHGVVVAKIVHVLATFLETHPIGAVCGDNLGVRFPNGNLRSPDVTFVRIEKVPTGEEAKEFATFIPDLAVEVLSPHDSLKEVGEKIGEFLDCGVPCVWLVDPARRTVTVYRSLSLTEQLDGDSVITAEDVLPGFSCSILRFF